MTMEYGNASLKVLTHKSCGEKKIRPIFNIYKRKTEFIVRKISRIMENSEKNWEYVKQTRTL